MTGINYGTYVRVVVSMVARKARVSQAVAVDWVACVKQEFEDGVPATKLADAVVLEHTKEPV